jgi:hypothetical protein
MLERSRAFKPSTKWTQYVRRQYGPAAASKVVVAWDTESGRWVLAYESSDHVVSGAGAYLVKWLKVFYIWQGQGNTYREPGPAMVQWLREHDVYAANSAEDWHKQAIAPDKKLAKGREQSAWDDVQYEFKQLYDAHGKPLQSSVGPMSHNLGTGPNAGSKFFGPAEHNVGWKDDTKRAEAVGAGSTGREG